VLGVTRSIAAYLASRLTQAVAQVDVILTGAAEKFVTPRPSIRNIDATRKGINLRNGRFITWNVEKMKIEMEELSLPRDIKARLLPKPQEPRCGQAIWSLLN